jgi:hypothetical protein
MGHLLAELYLAGARTILVRELHVHRRATLLFQVDVIPRSEDDVRISVAIDAADRLDALRRGLAEIGLEGGWVGPAAVVPMPDGSLRVTAPGGDRAFVVRRAVGEASEPVAATGGVGSPTRELAATPMPQAAPPVASDDLLLEESRLEEYFADEETPSEIEITPAVREPARASYPATRERVEAPPSVALPSERATEVVAKLVDLEEDVYDISTAMERAARVLRAPLQADVTCVLLVDRKGKALGFAGLAGDAPARLARYRYPKGLGLPWLSFDERRSLILNDIDRDAELHREVLEKTGFRIRATILAPIQSEGRTWGVLQAVRSAPDASGFDDSDLFVLEAAAGRVGGYLALFGTYL